MPSSEPHVFVVSGLPGAGKSTAARELARRFELGAHVEADRLQDLIVSGAVAPGLDGVDEPASRQLDLRLKNTCLLARSFVEAGFTAVIDEIVIGAKANHLANHLDGLGFTFVMLVPDFALVKQRWIDMDSPFADRWDWIDHGLRNETPGIDLRLDTTLLDPSETVDRILAHHRTSHSGRTDC